jgi:hypothetical protein
VPDPTAYLVAPDAPDASVSEGFVNPLDLFNYVSPSAWILATAEEVTGIDFLGWCTDALAGDWEAIWKFGNALINLADCMQDLGLNTQHAAIDMDADWDGNAADAAYQYFSTLAAATSGQQIALRQIGENYHKAALGAWQLSNQLANIAQAVADDLIISGILFAAGTATAETGAGAAVGYGLAALKIAAALEKINRASQIINTAGISIAGLFGGAVDLAYKGGDLTAVPLPKTAYAAPAA